MSVSIGAGWQEHLEHCKEAFGMRIHHGVKQGKKGGGYSDKNLLKRGAKRGWKIFVLVFTAEAVVQK